MIKQICHSLLFHGENDRSRRDPMSISDLNASNNLVDVKSDKLACLHLGILPVNCYTTYTYIYTYASSFVRSETHNKTPRLTPISSSSSSSRRPPSNSLKRPSVSRFAELRSPHNASTIRMLQLHSIPTAATAPCSRRNASKLQTRSLILYSALRA